MLTEITSFTSPKFTCKLCDFQCSKRGDYNRHILTAKHKKLTKHDTALTNYFCEECNKQYKSRVGLWSHNRNYHSNKNTSNTSSITSTDIQSQPSSATTTIDTETILLLIKQNQEFKELLIEQTKHSQCTYSHNTNSNNNSNNKTFNLQVFLNETCKDAMNITDFVNSIQVQLSDFENIGEQGYVNGISNLIIKNLKALDENMRPVHCSDLKRESIYIKDNDIWEKDTNDNEKLKKAIKTIAHKNTKMIPKYREKYPDSQKSYSRESDKYNRFVVEAMGGSGENDDEKTEKIVSKIAKEIVIQKEKGKE